MTTAPYCSPVPLGSNELRVDRNDDSRALREVTFLLFSKRMKPTNYFGALTAAFGGSLEKKKIMEKILYCKWSGHFFGTYFKMEHQVFFVRMDVLVGVQGPIWIGF